MISLQDLERIVPELIARLEQIRIDMSRYKKINTDYRAKTLMHEIEAKVAQIKKVHAAYKATPSYRNKDFENWVNLQEQYIKECKAIYEKIMKYESVAGYN